MAGTDWSLEEVEAIVADYIAMLKAHLAGTPYSKAGHRRALVPRLNGRSEKSVEFKHRNISAVLRDAGIQGIPGYRPLDNYQGLLAEVIERQLAANSELHALAAADADRLMVVPEVADILAIITKPPSKGQREHKSQQEVRPQPIRVFTNYLEREARNQSLGAAGELFILNFERARLIHAGKEYLASRIEHTSKVRGDHEGYDILSFNPDGSERLVEVKTTKYGIATPFYVSRNEMTVSAKYAANYQVYRLFNFRDAPRLFQLLGSIESTCQLSATTFLAEPR